MLIQEGCYGDAIIGAVTQFFTYDAGMAPGKSFPKAQYTRRLPYTPPMGLIGVSSCHKVQSLRRRTLYGAIPQLGRRLTAAGTPWEESDCAFGKDPPGTI
jgi:hypothetical protein